MDADLFDEVMFYQGVFSAAIAACNERPGDLNRMGAALAWLARLTDEQNKAARLIATTH